MIWGNDYAADGSCPVTSELQDGRILTVFYATIKGHEERIKEFECVRQIRSSSFRLV